MLVKGVYIGPGGTYPPLALFVPLFDFGKGRAVAGVFPAGRSVRQRFVPEFYPDQQVSILDLNFALFQTGQEFAIPCRIEQEPGDRHRLQVAFYGAVAEKFGRRRGGFHPQQAPTGHTQFEGFAEVFDSRARVAALAQSGQQFGRFG